MLLGCVELAKPGCLCPTCQRPLGAATAEMGGVDCAQWMSSLNWSVFRNYNVWKNPLGNRCSTDVTDSFSFSVFKKFSLRLKFVYRQKRCKRSEIMKRTSIFNYCEWRGSIILCNVGFLFDTINHLRGI